MIMKFQATAFLSCLPLFSSALLVPPPLASETSTPFLRSVAGSIGPDHVQIHFKATCDGCFIGTDDGLEVTLDVHHADKECTAAGLHLNGVPLDPTYWTDTPDSAGGALTLKTRSSNGLGERGYYTKWSINCLESEASLLHVVLYQEDGDGQRQSVGGFTTSFRQASQPWILKLNPTLSSSRIEMLVHHDWAFPSRDDALVIVTPGPPPPPPFIPPGLREELEKLSKLKLEEEQLNKEIKDAETDVMKIWKAEFANCSTLKCYVQTAIKDTPAFAKLIVNHLKHHGKVDKDFFKHSSHVNCSDKLDAVKAPEDQTPLDTMLEIPESENVQAVKANPVSQSTPLPPSPPEIPEEPATPISPSELGESIPPDHHDSPFHFGGPPPWVKDGDLPPWGAGPPPWVKDGGRPPWGDGPPPWIKDGTPPPWARPGFHPPPWAHHGDHPPFHPHGRPPFTFGHSLLSIRQQWKYRLIAAITSFVAVGLVAGLLFICIRHRTRIFRDPRRRADCAARREEWKRKKAYRKAACKYRFSVFLQKFRRAVPSSELEEKEGLMHNKEHNEGSAFGQEIGNLRAAQAFVGELVRAEEGRAHAAELDAGERGSITETLPAYSAPPSYVVDIDGDISVVDGFTGYTPSGTDRTPESSIIDCSPRMSFDTQRTFFTGSSDA